MFLVTLLFDCAFIRFSNVLCESNAIHKMMQHLKCDVVYCNIRIKTVYEENSLRLIAEILARGQPHREEAIACYAHNAQIT